MQWNEVATQGMPPTGACTEYVYMGQRDGCDSVLVHYASWYVEDSGGSRYGVAATAWLNGPYYVPGSVTHWTRIEPAPDHGKRTPLPAAGKSKP